MGKVRNKTAKIAIRWAAAVVSIVLFLLVAMPLAAGLILSFPTIQTAVVHRVTDMLSENLGTKISIDRINLKLVNHAVVHGFLVEDFHGDTLLYVGRLDAPIEKLGGPLSFGKVRLHDTQMWLRRDSTGMINIKELVNKIRGDRPKNPDPKFRMRIRGIEADSLTFGLLRWDKPFKNKGIDWSRFVIRNTNVRIDDFEIVRDTVRIGIESLSFDERSGFHLDDLSAHDLIVSNGAVSLDDVHIRGGATRLDVPQVRLVAENGDWQDFSDFTDSVSLGVRIRSSRLSTDFLRWFVPAVEPLRLTMGDLSLHTSGPVARLEGGVDNVNFLNSNLSFEFDSRNLDAYVNDDANAYVNAYVKNLSANAYDVNSLAEKLTKKGLSDKIFAPLQRLGRIDFSGSVEGNLDELKLSDGVFSTDAGGVNLAGSAKINGGSIAIDGNVSTAGLNVGNILSAKDLGVLAGSFAASVNLSKSEMNGSVWGDITALGFRGYTYSDITLGGTKRGGEITAKIASRDPNLDFDLDGTLSLAKDIHTDFVLDIRRADLAATHINRRDSASIVAGRVEASMSLSGEIKTDQMVRTLEDIQGSVNVSGASYTGPSGTIYTPPITIAAEASGGGKSLRLRSEFADASLDTHTSYSDLFAYMGEFLRDYIPTLYKTEPVNGAAKTTAKPQTGETGATLKVTIKNADKLLAALAPGTQLAAGSELEMHFDPYAHTFSMAASSEFIEYKDILAGQVKLSLGNTNTIDSLTLSLSTGDLYVGKLHIPQFSLAGEANNTDVNLSVRLADPDKNFSATLGARIDNDEGGKLRIRLTPSRIVLDDKRWGLTSREIGYSDGRLSVDGFSIFSALDPAQQITMRGAVSKSTADTLRVTLNDFDLSPLGRVVKDNKLSMEGRVGGHVELVSGGAMQMNAVLDMTDMTVNGSAVAPLRFVGSSDRTGRQIRLRVTNRTAQSDILSGSFTPKTGAVDVTANIRGLDMSLLDAFLPGVIESTRGRADVNVRAHGTLKNLHLDGGVDIADFQTTVGYTNVAYTLAQGHADIVGSMLKLPPTPINDLHGNSGTFAMNIDARDLSAVEIDLEATLNNMLALDTAADENEVFYGHVFATGGLKIHSGKMDTRMDISVQTDKGSKFYLPLNAKRGISWSDFVAFSSGAGEQDYGDVLVRKRLVFARKQMELNPVRRQKPLDLDLTVGVTPEAEIHMLIDPNLGNGITASGEGVLNLRINPATNLFTMTGDYIIDTGRVEFSMMDVFNKDFTIAPGSSLRWSGEANDATMNIEAAYRVRASLMPLLGEGETLSDIPSSVQVDCILGLRGTLAEPDITFDIRLPSVSPEVQSIVDNSINTQELKSMQFLALLTTGSFAADNSIAGQTTGSGIAAGGAVGIDILTHQLGSLLSSDDYNIYLRYRPQNEYTGNQVDLGFTTNIAGNRLLLEIEGNYVEDRELNEVGVMSKNATNLSGDVALTWLITPSGNLRLKVFSQAIDRMNETQGLQESGLGFYWKKDFNRARDIFRRTDRSAKQKSANLAARDSVRLAKKMARTQNKATADSVRLAKKEERKMQKELQKQTKKQK